MRRTIYCKYILCSYEGISNDKKLQKVKSEAALCKTTSAEGFFLTTKNQNGMHDFVFRIN